MSRRRTPHEGAEVPIMPRELLEPRNRGVRREWYALYLLHTWPEQHAALVRSREAHGLGADGRGADAADPRDLFRDLANDSPSARRRRVGRPPDAPDLPPPF